MALLTLGSKKILHFLAITLQLKNCMVPEEAVHEWPEFDWLPIKYKRNFEFIS